VAKAKIAGRRIFKMAIGSPYYNLSGKKSEKGESSIWGNPSFLPLVPGKHSIVLPTRV